MRQNCQKNIRSAENLKSANIVKFAESATNANSEEKFQ